MYIRTRSNAQEGPWRRQLFLARSRLVKFSDCQNISDLSGAERSRQNPVHTCWEIGRHLVEIEQGGANRAALRQHRLEIRNVLWGQLSREAPRPDWSVRGALYLS